MSGRGKRGKTRGNKYAYLAQTKPRDVLGDLVSTRPPVDRIFIKPDENQLKKRWIIAGDVSVYLKMEYLAAERVFRGLPSPLVRSGRLALEDAAERIRLVGERTASVPLDQTGFDHQITVEMVLTAIRVMREFYTDARALEIFDLLLEQLPKTVLSYKKRTGTVFERRWRNGLLSGWRWTGVLNTVINLAEFEVVRTQLGPWDKVVFYSAMGDDDDVFASDLATCVQIALLYRHNLGPEALNLKKFFISRTTSEYLRKITAPGRTVGYPARLLNSILWRKPQSEPQNNGGVRLEQIGAS